MVQIENTLISFDIFDQQFICDLTKCKGICCVEGESGAPVESDEKEILEQLVEVVWDDLAPEAQEIILQQGPTYKDLDGELVTSIVKGKDCVFTCYDANGWCKCAIEKAFEEGKTNFKKPISCHLYPIRLQKYKDYTAVNYHQWSVCECARKLGKKERLPLYKFLKEPLIRKFGEKWYHELEICAKELRNHPRYF